MALTQEVVGDTTYCHLGMRIAPSTLDVMIYNPMAENSLIVSRFDIDPCDRRKSLEEVVYDNPALLGDFAKKRVVIESPDFTIVPMEISDPAVCDKLFDIAVPDVDRPYQLISNSVEALGANFITAIPLAEMNFLSRTFYNPTITLNLPLLCRYFASQITPGSVKTFINLRDDSADVIILGTDRLYLANRFRFKEIDDLVFYILASFNALKIQPTDILVTGVRDRRDNLLTRLRNFCSNVMVMIFPSAMYRAGKVAMNSPFDLIILPLCE